MNKDLNLGVVIGIFFSVAGVLLMGYGMLYGEAAGRQINIACGTCYLIFGAVMLLGSYFPANKKNNKTDESGN